MKKGFTLLELLIVVIIIGVLAAVAVPQYIRSVERARVAKAKNALGLICKAEKMFRAEQDTYVDCAVASWAANALSPDFTELSELNADDDWDYDVGGPSDVDSFLATATRTGGPGWATGTIITMNQDGVCLGSHPLRGPDCM